MSRVRVVALGEDALRALVDGDLTRARELTGLPLTDWFASERWLWQIRLADVAADPRAAAWVAGPVVDEQTGEVVGHAGFHGPPDSEGMVEVGCTTDPSYRRRGYARAALLALLARADADPAVRRVRASVSPGNAASLATLAGLGFEPAGEQWDDEDGLELLFLRPADPPRTPR